MHVEYRAVGGGGTVEGDLLAYAVACPCHGLLGLAGHDKARPDELEVGKGAAGLLQAPFHSGDGDLTEVLLGAEGVADQTVADFAGHLTHERSDRSQEHLRWATVVGARVEEGRHEGVLVEVAAKVQLLPVVPRCPDGPDRADHLAHPRCRVRPLHREPLGYVGLDLGAQAEDEATVGVALEVVAEVRQEHRVAREGHRDGGAQLDPLGVLRCEHVGQKRVMARLGGPGTRIAGLLELPCRFADGSEAAGARTADSSVDLHAADGTRGSTHR